VQLGNDFVNPEKLFELQHPALIQTITINILVIMSSWQKV